MLRLQFFMVGYFVLEITLLYQFVFVCVIHHLLFIFILIALIISTWLNLFNLWVFMLYCGYLYNLFKVGSNRFIKIWLLPSFFIWAQYSKFTANPVNTQIFLIGFPTPPSKWIYKFIGPSNRSHFRPRYIALIWLIY